MDPHHLLFDQFQLPPLRRLRRKNGSESAMIAGSSSRTSLEA